MIEMFGVWVKHHGVSVGGIAGYLRVMSKFRVNKTILSNCKTVWTLLCSSFKGMSVGDASTFYNSNTIIFKFY